MTADQLPLVSALDELYWRTAERQHAPDGIMTKVKERWAALNGKRLAVTEASRLHVCLRHGRPGRVDREGGPEHVKVYYCPECLREFAKKWRHLQ